MQPSKYSRFLPFEKYTVLTTLSEEEVIERLRIITRTTNKLRFSSRTAVILRSNYDYVGNISGKSFEIWRSINYQNSFLPIITGTVSSHLDKTEIRISMNMTFFAKTVTIIGLSIACMSTFIGFEFYPLNFNAFIPLILLVGGYLVVLLGFKLEAKKSKKDLKKIFNVLESNFL